MKTHRSSTLDIISRTTSHARLSLTAQTGDILLGGVSRDTKDRLLRFVIAFGGHSSTERRLPIVHAAVVIRDPPPEVRVAYGLPQDDDSQVYVLQASRRHPDGCRLKTIEAWAEDSLDLKYRIFYRGIAIGEGDRKMPQEFWDWLLVARETPFVSIFSKHGSSVAYNGFFNPGCYSSTVAVATELTMEMIEENLLGKGPIAHILAGFAGVLANIVGALVLAGLILFTFVVSLPHHLWKKKIDRVYVDGDGLTCSATVAKTLMRAGLLKTTADATWYLPRDFLPQGVGAHTNFLDNNLVPGVHYLPFLSEIQLQKNIIHPHGRHSFVSVLETALMQLEDNL